MKIIKLFLSIALFLWSMGFFYFFHITNNDISNNDLHRSEAIIAWGDDFENLYISTQLLKLGYSNIVFVTSGKNENSLREFLKSYNAVQDQFVFNKYTSNKKHDYAKFTAEFLQKHDVDSIRIVINTYQLPRALKQLKQTIPSDIDIIPHPISQKNQDSYRVFKEYAKYTLVLLASFIGKENELDLSYS